MTFSTAYHLQADGQSEIVNKSLETYLLCFVGDMPKDWVRWVPLAEWWYNTGPHTSSKLTPFEALYGYKPPKILSYSPCTIVVEEVDVTLRFRDYILQLLKHNLSRAQERMKKNVDLNRKEQTFSIGDWVYLRL